ncbi:serpentine type 7TM GPCR chemoreceptor str domain-containing protein [Ditylenchus destructor]|uniref:Serpentine type 7TM GPCR chemoreceptor str domain-containing protein n=1 Tax=Ditylenchus destructor TaxID=166010 RepID=A0AAD4MW88_9BILA|nr:serpentine type 7TM GPCR chemoreceptor str domain-containing protein [Ditylenchus destructor]
MEEVHHIVETIVNSLSILFNCYLLYLIRYYSTFEVKLYQYLLSIDAMLDLCLGVSAIMAQPKEWRMIAYVILWTTTSCASIIIVIWCEKRIDKIFMPLGDFSHGNAQRMHKEFQRALLAMAICPLFTTSIPVFYFMATIAFQLCPGQISAMMTICLSSISLFNPLTTIICFRCFRQATIRFVSCGQRSASVSSAENAMWPNGSSAISDKTNATS